MSAPALTRDQIAAELVPRRDEFIRRLPREIRKANRLTEDLRALVVDDALTYVVVDNTKAIATHSDAEALLWGTATNRVNEAIAGRYDTVRGQFRPVDLGDVDAAGLCASDDPARAAEKRLDRAVLAEFVSTLNDTERAVYQRKWRPELRYPAGWRTIARELGLSAGLVRKTERSIGSKLKAFAALYTAGLCEKRTVELSAAAANTAAASQAARAHIAHCDNCKTEYVAQLRAVRSAEVQRQIASILPVPPLAETAERHGAQLRDFIADLASRLLGNDTATSVASVAATGVGRGSGAMAALKIAALLAASTSAGIGAGVGSGIIDLRGQRDSRERVQRQQPAPEIPARIPERPPVPRAGDAFQRQQAALEARRAAQRRRARERAQRRQRRQRLQERQTATQGGTGPTAQVQAPASPAPAGALPDGGSEFSPDGAALPPAPPAPPPAAPGASEFGP